MTISAIRPADIQSHLYSSFLQGHTADVVLRVSGRWKALYRLHRVVLIQAVSGVGAPFDNDSLSRFRTFSGRSSPQGSVNQNHSCVRGRAALKRLTSYSTIPILQGQVRSDAVWGCGMNADLWF